MDEGGQESGPRSGPVPWDMANRRSLALRSPHIHRHNPHTTNTEEYRDQIGTAFHSEYRSIQTKVNNAAHTTTKNSFRAQRGGSAREGVRANVI